MAKENKDNSVLRHIDQLVKEEERLYGKGQLNAGDQKRLAELKVELDQYWDLFTAPPGTRGVRRESR
jgi:hypothetical protein